MKKRTKNLEKILIIILLSIITTICGYLGLYKENETESIVSNEISYEISNIPEYNGIPYLEINGNNPTFREEDMNIDEYYSDLKNERVRNGYYKNQLGKSKQ